MEKVTIEELREEHVEAATDVIARSFLGLNDIWKGYNPTYQQIYPIVRGKVIPGVNGGWSFVLLKNNKVIGVSIQYEMNDYLSAPTMLHESKLFKVLGKYGGTLENPLKGQEWVRGKAIYGLYGVIDPQEAGQGHSLKFWWTLFALGKVAGWKEYYTRASNPQSYRMLKKLGAEDVSHVNIDEAEMRNQKIWLVKIDLTKDFPTYNMLLQLTQSKQPRASL